MLPHLLEHSPNLTEISFDFITDEMLRLIASHCRSSLRIIDAETVLFNSSEAIIAIFKACPNLVSLSFSDVNSESTSLPGDAITLAAVQYCPRIEVLPTHIWKSTDIAMNALATIHSLKELTLTSSSEFSISSLKCVLQSNPRVERISIQCVDDEILSCIGRHCRNLTSFRVKKPYIFSVSDASFHAFVAGCPLLTEFRVEHRLGRMHNSDLRVLFHNCCQLTTLNLSTTEYSFAYDDTEHILYTPFLSLIRLIIANEAITTTALHDILIYCINIREVYLETCKQVTDETLRILTQYCCSIECLHIESCKYITSAGILEVVTNCTTLTYLYLSHIPITDEILMQLSTHCLNLNTLCIQGCHGPISETCILHIVNKCTRLSYLRMTGCGVVVTPAIMSLIQGGMCTQLYVNIHD